jgi:hypothetical protein
VVASYSCQTTGESTNFTKVNESTTSTRARGNDIHGERKGDQRCQIALRYNFAGDPPTEIISLYKSLISR